MRPPRLRCTLFSLIYPPHLLGSYKRQLYGFVLFSRLTKRNLASYVISVRRTKSSLTASFRFYLTIDTLAVQLYTSLSPRRVRDFHPLERAHGAQTKTNAPSRIPGQRLYYIFLCFILPDPQMLHHHNTLSGCQDLRIHKYSYCSAAFRRWSPGLLRFRLRLLPDILQQPVRLRC